MKQTALAKRGTDTLDFKTQAAAKIKRLLGEIAENTIAAGHELIAVKATLKHGEWGPWLRDECEMSERMAQRLMSVAECFKNDNLSDLNIAPSALYLLASPSTPDDIRQSMLEQARSGARITVAAVHQAIGPGEETNEELPAFEKLPPLFCINRPWLMRACEEAKALAPVVTVDYQRIGAIEDHRADEVAGDIASLVAANEATRKMRFLVNWDCGDLEIVTNNMCYAAEGGYTTLYWEMYRHVEDVLRHPWFKPDALSAFRLEFNPQ